MKILVILISLWLTLAGLAGYLIYDYYTPADFSLLPTFTIDINIESLEEPREAYLIFDEFGNMTEVTKEVFYESMK